MIGGIFFARKESTLGCAYRRWTCRTWSPHGAAETKSKISRAAKLRWKAAAKRAYGVQVVPELHPKLKLRTVADPCKPLLNR
jgi:hypothetical protein